MMDNNCGVIRDLLPLYVDGACSDASRRLVEEHIQSCPACAKNLARLRDSACEDTLRQEARAVLAPRKWRNRAFAASCALAAFLCVPACLVAALGRGSGADYPLSWLLLLAPSMLVVLAATLLPLRCRRYTGRWTLLGYTASLLLLMIACWVYTADGGAQRYLFAAGAALLYVFSALSILPWALRELPLPGRFAGKKRLATLVWDGTFALALAEGALLTASGRHPALLALSLALLAALTAAAVVLLGRGLWMDRLARAGICVAVAGNALAWALRPILQLTGAEKNAASALQTAQVAVLIAATGAGLALTAAGAWRAYRRVKKTP